MKEILGVDFDDVLFDTNGSAAEFHNLHYGTSYTREDNKDFLFEHLWDCPPEEVERRLDHYYETDFHHGAPMIGGVKEALTELSERFDIIVITARPEERRGVTEAWIQKNLPGLITKVYHTDFFISEKPEEGRFKSDLCRELGVSYFVDDTLAQVKDIAHHAKTHVFLFDAPWNRSETPPGTVRVHSWADITGRLMKN